MLEEIRRLGGIAVISGSHCHGYGALWKLQEVFGAPLAIQRDDLRMTKVMRVTDPYDEALDIGEGLTLHHVGGHYEGQACLHDGPRSAPVLRRHVQGGPGRGWPLDRRLQPQGVP